MLESQNVKEQFVIGTSATFDFGVRFFSPNDISCYEYNPNTKTEVLLSSGTDYTIEEKTDYSSGAKVTLLGTLNAGNVLTIVRTALPVQDVSLPNFGKIPSESLETQLDRETAVTQQLHDTVQLTLRMPYGVSGTQTPEQYVSGLVSSVISSGGGGWVGDYAASAGYANSAGYAVSAGYATSGGYATSAGSATSAANATAAGSAVSAGYATSAGQVSYADSAGYATDAGDATSAASAGYAASAGKAPASGGTASYASSAGKAPASGGTATYASSAGYATSAGYASYAGGGGGSMVIPDYSALDYANPYHSSLSTGTSYIADETGWLRISLHVYGNAYGCFGVQIGGGSMGLMQLNGSGTPGMTWMFPVSSGMSFYVQSPPTSTSVLVKYDKNVHVNDD